MRSDWKKRLAALMLAGAMAFSLTACGAKDEQTQETQTDETGMTVEGYQQAVTALSEDISTIQSEAAHVADDPEAAEQALEKLKTTLSTFMAIDAPEKYAAGHQKVREGCAAMVEYIDLVIGTAEQSDAASQEQTENQMASVLAEASEALQQGVDLLRQADESE